MCPPNPNDEAAAPQFERPPDAEAALPRVYRVAELAALITRAIGERFPEPVLVEGEISNLRRQPSGHLYFSLNDPSGLAKIDAVWFARRQTPIAARLADGQQVRVRGDVGTYEPSSRYQIRVHEVTPAGRGALWEAFERLKERLAAEGLFAAERKRPLPRLPRAIGVVTSPAGAALRDILNVIGRRFPNMRIVVSPCRVQGEGAAAEIASAIDRIGQWPGVEVVIVARGGGSMEDLWAFNEEPVVRAIARCPVPVITGIGHETDFTLADFAADLRAPTPSAAAERAVEPRKDLADRIAQLSHRLRRAAAHSLVSGRTQLRELQSTYAIAARRRIARLRQQLDETHARLRQSLGGRAARLRAALAAIPVTRLERALRRVIEQRREHCRHLDARRRSLDPAAVLRRGYSITRHADGRLVTADDLPAPGDRLRTQTAVAEIDSDVQKVRMNR
ncbi:MAG: exodeoxyribonuclease VII large subunit [Kiritimatiellae bacterium]|nr:exodeoxyribonuclease VII large subunit [Kiritimatiellia bacterium]